MRPKGSRAPPRSAARAAHDHTDSHLTYGYRRGERRRPSHTDYHWGHRTYLVPPGDGRYARDGGRATRVTRSPRGTRWVRVPRSVRMGGVVCSRCVVLVVWCHVVLLLSGLSLRGCVVPVPVVGRVLCCGVCCAVCSVVVCVVGWLKVCCCCCGDLPREKRSQAWESGSHAGRGREALAGGGNRHVGALTVPDEG